MGDKKSLNLGSMLKVKPTGLTDRLKKGIKKKKRFTNPSNRALARI